MFSSEGAFGMLNSERGRAAVGFGSHSCESTKGTCHSHQRPGTSMLGVTQGAPHLT